MTIIEITQANLAAHEWIGLNAVVTASTDPKRIGQKGRIVWETKNTIVVEKESREIVLPKKEVTLEMDLNGKTAVLDAKNWCFSPQDRIKAWIGKKGK